MSKQKRAFDITLQEEKVTNLQYISRWLVHYKVSYNANKWVIHEAFPPLQNMINEKNSGKNIIEFSIFITCSMIFQKKITCMRCRLCLAAPYSKFLVPSVSTSSVLLVHKGTPV
jgi:hypothetical protein